jgi:transposase
MARPTKCDEHTADKVATFISAGNAVEIAVQAAGISPATHYTWMQRGTKRGKRDAPYRYYWEAIEPAYAEAEAKLVSRLAAQAAKGSIRAAQFLLERRYPERWADPSKRPPADPDEGDQGGAPKGLRDELAAQREKKAAGRG